MYNTGLWGENRTGVGAFYFGETTTVDAPLNNIFITALEPTVYTFKSVTLDFTGNPIVDYSPFTSQFTATCQILNSSGLVLSGYDWYFDYDRSPGVYVSTTENTISHEFNGYVGKTYSVKCVATFVNSGLTFEVYKKDYITMLGEKIPIRFGKDFKVNLTKFIPEALR